jgi:hypothetical protein
MDPEEVQNLQPGDEVFWQDPDVESACSRVYRIHSITVHGEAVRIVDVDGSSLECFASELS